MAAPNERDSKGGGIELVETHAGSGNSAIGLHSETASEEDFGRVDSRMSFAKWMACIALGLSYTTAIQQHSCTATIVKHIDIALGPTTYYNWIISGHNVTVSLILPLAGGLSDIFGRRYFFLVGCSFSLIGTIVALAATSTKSIIAGMVLKGVGSGAQQLALPAIAEIVPNKHRGTAQAVLDLVGLPWTVFGALIGNSMVKYYALSFRVNFIIGILLNVLTMVMIFFFYKPPRGTLPEGQSAFKAFIELDWTGIALLACGIVPTLVGISSGGSLFPWLSAGVIAPLSIGVLSFIALFFWQWKGAKNPFFSPELFEGKNNRFGVCLILTFIAGMSLYAIAAFWTQQCQAMFFSDPTKIGLSGIPSGVGGVIGGLFGAMLIGRGRLFKAQYVLFYGACLKMIADGLFTTLDPTKLILGMGAGFLAMLGVGAVMLAVIVTVQLTCSDKHIGLATLILASVRSLGGAVSVSIYSAIMNNTLKKDAPVRIAAAASELSPEAVKSLVPVLMGGRSQEGLKIPGVTPEILSIAMEAIKWSWAAAFQRIYWAAMAFTGVAIITALFVKDVTENMTDNVAVILENDHGMKRKEMP